MSSVKTPTCWHSSIVRPIREGRTIVIPKSGVSDVFDLPQ